MGAVGTLLLTFRCSEDYHHSHSQSHNSEDSQENPQKCSHFLRCASLLRGSRLLQVMGSHGIFLGLFVTPETAHNILITLWTE